MTEQCSDRDRFHLDLEFVQCLASPEYVSRDTVTSAVLLSEPSLWVPTGMSRVMQVPELVGTTRLLR